MPILDAASVCATHWDGLGGVAKLRIAHAVRQQLRGEITLVRLRELQAAIVAEAQGGEHAAAT